MEEHHDRALSILEELGARPAAPFFEDGPAGYITEVLDRLEVSTRRDAYGNIVAHYSGNTDGSQPPVAFVAHMDHPGFELVSRGDDGAFTARALGGVPAASLRKPTRALVLAADGSRVPAELVPIASPTPEQPAERLVTARVGPEASFELPAPVVFDLPDFELDGDTIRMRALDDLAGCASILAALERLVADGADADVYAVFTRAEEVGLIGARLVAEAGTLPEETLVVSVESSAVIPGVAQGKGPVIRTGDAARTFDADAEMLLIAARESIREREPGFSCQRQLMSGGTCEATAFGAFGYSVTGVAFPLGNYHNATTSIPDPDGGVGAEYINLSDYLGGVDLIAEAATSAAGRDRRQPRWASQAIPDDMRRRLQDTLPAP
jgi:putative aminopeptidase FrvX